ncbi:hypothetical protein SAMN05216268_113139 [Streptomyces yunnanensis]|uniref:Uncharacterized protein n=1 Tax=Streptomyces yunnanensis TaxID=156453 RepID=A0A9X8N263_9ACTN|nr:hypothetical protein SAMN05216268_113139 [Streptomyces yunnanensis]
MRPARYGGRRGPIRSATRRGEPASVRRTTPWPARGIDEVPTVGRPRGGRRTRAARPRRRAVLPVLRPAVVGWSAGPSPRSAHRGRERARSAPLWSAGGCPRGAARRRRATRTAGRRLAGRWFPSGRVSSTGRAGAWSAARRPPLRPTAGSGCFAWTTRPAWIRSVIRWVHNVLVGGVALRARGTGRDAGIPLLPGAAGCGAARFRAGGRPYRRSPHRVKPRLRRGQRSVWEREVVRRTCGGPASASGASHRPDWRRPDLTES